MYVPISKCPGEMTLFLFIAPTYGLYTMLVLHTLPLDAIGATCNHIIQYKLLSFQ